MKVEIKNNLLLDGWLFLDDKLDATGAGVLAQRAECMLSLQETWVPFQVPPGPKHHGAVFKHRCGPKKQIYGWRLQSLTVVSAVSGPWDGNYFPLSFFKNQDQVSLCYR